MPFVYSEKYSAAVDELFTAASKTDPAVNNNFDFVGVETVKVYSVPTAEMHDYKLTGDNRYGVPEELESSVQELKLSQDKSFAYTIDRKSEDDSVMSGLAGASLARQIKEKIVPMVDTYRLAQMVAGAKNEVVEATLTEENAYKSFLKVNAAITNEEAPMDGRIAFVTPDYADLLKLDPRFTKYGDMATQIAIKGMIGGVDNVPIIPTPANRFPEGVSLIITNPIACPAPFKLIQYRTHIDPPGISGWRIEGRVRYDCFVLKNKAGAICYLTSTALKSSADDGTSGDDTP